MTDSGFPKPEKIIETERLELRYRNLEDASICFQLIEKNRDHLKSWLPWVESTLKVSDSETYFKLAQDLWKNGKLYDFSIFLKGTKVMIGSGGIHSINWEKRTCDLGYWLDKDQIGKGYASEACLALEATARDLGIHRLCIECDPKNTRSASVATRLGYIQESLAIDDLFLDGKYRDTLCFVKLLNPQVPNFVTDNFPRGYGLKKVDTLEYKKIEALITKEAWDDSLVIRNSDQMEFSAPNTNFENLFRLNYILYFEDKPIGCFYGQQTHRDTFQMSSSYIVSEHQNRKLYSRTLDIIVKEICDQGFKKIISSHYVTHSKIIATKLKRGFIITGMTVNLSAGTMAELTFFNDSKRKKILEFRSGQKAPDKELKEIFKL